MVRFFSRDPIPSSALILVLVGLSLSTAGCLWPAAVGGAVLGSDSGGSSGGLTTNVAPQVTAVGVPYVAVSPDTRKHSPTLMIRVGFTVSDQNDDSISVDLGWSPNIKKPDPMLRNWFAVSTIVSVDYLPATISGNSISNLPAPSGGTIYELVWDATSDLITPTVDVLVRMRGRDGGTGGTGNWDESGSFVGGNSVPVITYTEPVGASTVSQLVRIRYTLIDDTSDPIEIEDTFPGGSEPYAGNPSNPSLEYSTDSGANWQAATTTGGTTVGVLSSPSGVTHEIFWDSL